MVDHAVAIPILPVRDMAEAVEFWSRVPHLTVDTYDHGYSFVRHLGAEVIHLGYFPDMNVEANKTGCYLHVPGIDALRSEFAAAGLPVSDRTSEDHEHMISRIWLLSWANVGRAWWGRVTTARSS